MRPRRLAETTGVLALATALTVLMTWPLVPRLGSVGRVNTGDGQLSIWNVAWVARTIVTNPRNLYNANIFYPHKRTLAYSESNLGAGVLALPIWWGTRNPFAAHNFALAAAFVLTFCTTFLLARYLTGRPAAAIIAAIAFTFCPFMFARFAHIQLVMTFGLPLSLWALHRLVDDPNPARAVVLGGALWVQAMACSYYGVFAALVVGLGVIFFAVTRRLWRSPRYWTMVALAAVISIAATVPFFVPYLRIQEELGFTRTIIETRRYSADWRSWLASSAWAHRWMLPTLGEWNDVLFPGLVLTILGIAGCVLALTRMRPDGRDGSTASLSASARFTRQTGAFYLLTLMLAFWASFGPDAGSIRLLPSHDSDLLAPPGAGPIRPARSAVPVRPGRNRTGVADSAASDGGAGDVEHARRRSSRRVVCRAAAAAHRPPSPACLQGAGAAASPALSPSFPSSSTAWTFRATPTTCSTPPIIGGRW